MKKFFKYLFYLVIVSIIGLAAWQNKIWIADHSKSSWAWMQSTAESFRSGKVKPKTENLPVRIVAESSQSAEPETVEQVQQSQPVLIADAPKVELVNEQTFEPLERKTETMIVAVSEQVEEEINLAEVAEQVIEEIKPENAVEPLMKEVAEEEQQAEEMQENVIITENVSLESEQIIASDKPALEDKQQIVIHNIESQDQELQAEVVEHKPNEDKTPQNTAEFPDQKYINLIRKAKELSWNGKLDEAESILRKQFKEFPLFIPAGAELAQILVRQGRYEEADKVQYKVQLAQAVAKRKAEMYHLKQQLRFVTDEQKRIQYRLRMLDAQRNDIKDKMGKL